MDKKRNQVARNGQGSSGEYKTTTTTKIIWNTSTFTQISFFFSDASNKQFPRQRRRESYQPENNNNGKQQASKNRNNNFYYEKRPPGRKGGNGGGGLDQQAAASCEATGLIDAVDELNSVFNHGSKKQNLNHLLNFHYYNSKESEDVRAGTFSKHGYHHHRSYGKKYNFNKEQVRTNIYDCYAII